MLKFKQSKQSKEQRETVRESGECIEMWENRRVGVGEGYLKIIKTTY